MSLRPSVATASVAAVLTEVRAGLAGAITIGQPICYRVQSPTFTIEFARQQGQGANAGGITHSHAIYREPGNDYGAGLS